MLMRAAKFSDSENTADMVRKGGGVRIDSFSWNSV